MKNVKNSGIKKIVKNMAQIRSVESGNVNGRRERLMIQRSHLLIVVKMWFVTHLQSHTAVNGTNIHGKIKISYSEVETRKNDLT